ncbi:MAG: heme lyase CcmF/NrfE family subunit [Proteobacteria bacterium]|nr:heme lyase CcmF/NrfE family subunit [Pseudomonadota bacterium]
MLEIGLFFLACSWIISVYGIAVGFYAAKKNNIPLTLSTQKSVSLTCHLAVASLISLAIAFVKHDYHYVYVWQHSNNEMPWYYLISAVWGGMDGSLLLWAALVCVFAFLVMRKVETYPVEISKYLAPVLSSANFFFLTVVLFLTNPFRVVPNGQIPPDGNGLNPLLQNPSMLIHPPMLYLGFTGLVVPFAFCLSSLLSGTISEQWIKLTKRWALVAWCFLTFGIILGGNWAYIELGWGGFWAWDPVENASFLPWLTSTAFIHSVLVQEQKNMLRIWNVFLSILSYVLAVFGTFLTRSGVVQSVHAFGQSDVGWVFLAYIGVIIVVSTALVIYRYDILKSTEQLESYFSREAAFLFNNLILLAICFATLWGVIFPVISEWLVGEKRVVGIPFFNQVNIPLFLFLLFLMGVGPVVSWKRSSFKSWFNTFIKPFSVGCVVTLFFIWFEPSRFYPALSFGLATFVLFTVEADVRRALKVKKELTKKSSGIVELYKRRPHRYGGLLVHCGIAIMAVSITASMAYKIEKDVVIKVGESAVVGNYKLVLEDLVERKEKNYYALVTKVKVLDSKSDKFLSYLNPERRFYTRSQETTSEIDIRMTPRDDLYLAMTGVETPKGVEDLDPTKTAAVYKVFVNPLQVWLWFGGMIVLGGALLIVIPNFAWQGVERVKEKLFTYATSQS